MKKDDFKIGKRIIKSRLIVGTGKYKNFKQTADAVKASGAQHEMGDVEIEGRFYGCKRRKAVPAWVKPEKQEDGVIFREDRQEPQIAIPLEVFLELLQIKHKGCTDEDSKSTSDYSQKPERD